MLHLKPKLGNLSELSAWYCFKGIKKLQDLRGSWRGAEAWHAVVVRDSNGKLGEASRKVQLQWTTQIVDSWL